MNEKCYSINEEDFSYDEIDDAINSYIDDTYKELEVGSIFIIYEGDAIKYKAGEFTGYTLDQIQNAAYDEGGEYSEDYLSDVTKEQEADLDKRIEDVVNQWADDHGLQPNFYKVQNVKEVKVKITGTIENNFEYEILEDSNEN